MEVNKKKIIGMLTNFLWNIRFTFADGARHKKLWKEEHSLVKTAVFSPWNSSNPENIFYNRK